MDWVSFSVLAVLIKLTSSQCIGRPYTVSPAQPTVVDGNVVQSLIDTIQLFIVSDLLGETLPEKQKVIVAPQACCDVSVYEVDYPEAILPYEFVYDKDCPDFVTAILPRHCVPKKVSVNIDLNDQFVYDTDCPEFVTALVPRSPKRLCVNYGLNEELVLPPLAPELPCGLGYLPGGLPVVAKAFAPCSKCCACGCGCTPCSSAALPICSPYSCAALSDPLCPDLSPFVKPVIL